MAQPWYLYLIECVDGSYYAGISPDPAARFEAHRAGKGARYTRSHPPRRLLGTSIYPNRSAASKAEWAIKQLPRSRKLAFLRAPPVTKVYLPGTKSAEASAS